MESPYQVRTRRSSINSTGTSDDASSPSMRLSKIDGDRLIPESELNEGDLGTERSRDRMAAEEKEGERLMP